MYGIIDCDNCYVSCERVFRPDLNDKPVVVLSNNDGCVVARSNEAKKMGIKAGTPYFQLAEQFPNNKIAVFSSNYELYGELTGRVVNIIRQEAPAYFRYSIDECFVYLKGMENHDLKLWGENLHKKIKQYVGMPVSIGLAPNKTLAKMASHFAKKYPGYRHCCMIDSEEKRIKALKLYPVEDVWGIGRRYAARMDSMGIKTAYDFASHHGDYTGSQLRSSMCRKTEAAKYCGIRSRRVYQHESLPSRPPAILEFPGEKADYTVQLDNHHRSGCYRGVGTIVHQRLSVQESRGHRHGYRTEQSYTAGFVRFQCRAV